MKRQHIVLGASLLVTLIAAYFSPDPDQGVVAPSSKPQTNFNGKNTTSTVGVSSGAVGARVASGVRSMEVLAIRPRIAGDDDQGPFPSVSWEPPPQAPIAVKVKEEKPPPPQAPPLPFKVMGQYSEGSVRGVFLLHNDRSLVAKVGEVLADQYRVESLKDGVLTLIYLPLQQRQTLAVSTSN